MTDYRIVESTCELEDCPTAGTVDGHGRRYSVLADRIPDGYLDQGPERAADFVADVPAPKRARVRPSRKRAAPIDPSSTATPDATAGA